MDFPFVVASDVLASQTGADDPAIGFGVHFLVALLIAGLIALTARKQRGADDLLLHHGWKEAAPGSVGPSTGQVAVTPDPRGGTRTHVITGRWRGWQAERFQWHAPRGKEIGTQTWVELVRLPAGLPTLTLSPRGYRPKGILLVAVDRDSLAREFRKYWFLDDIGGRAASVLTEPVMRAFLADDALHVPVNIAGDVIFTRVTTWRRAHKGVEARLDFLTRIAEAIPNRAHEKAPTAE